MMKVITKDTILVSHQTQYQLGSQCVQLAGDHIPPEHFCSSLSVSCRVYADVVLNHMTNEAGYTNLGSAGTWYDSTVPDYPYSGISAEDIHGPGDGPSQYT